MEGSVLNTQRVSCTGCRSESGRNYSRLDTASCLSTQSLDRIPRPCYIQSILGRQVSTGGNIFISDLPTESMPPSSSEAIYEETLAVFDEQASPFEPLTTPEIADALDCGRRTAYHRLDTLVDRGEVVTKKVGSGARVWWRQPAEQTSTVTWGTTERKHTEAERDLLYKTTRSIAQSATFDEGLQTAVQDICEAGRMPRRGFRPRKGNYGAQRQTTTRMTSPSSPNSRRDTRLPMAKGSPAGYGHLESSSGQPISRPERVGNYFALTKP
jgi:hypothetical protein